MTDDPGVLELVLAAGGAEDDVVDPMAVLGGGGEGGAVVDAADVDALAGRADEIGPGGVGDGVEGAVDLFNDEDVPLAVDALGGVVVVEGGLVAVSVVAGEGLGDEPLGVGAAVGLGGGWGVGGGVGVVAEEGDEADDQGRDGEGGGEAGGDALRRGAEVLPGRGVGALAA